MQPSMVVSIQMDEVETTDKQFIIVMPWSTKFLSDKQYQVYDQCIQV